MDEKVSLLEAWSEGQAMPSRLTCGLSLQVAAAAGNARSLIPSSVSFSLLLSLLVFWLLLFLFLLLCFLLLLSLLLLLLLLLLSDKRSKGSRKAARGSKVRCASSQQR